MIGFIQGEIVDIEPAFVTLAVSGIGYHLHISLHTYTTIKEKKNVKLLTHLQVREDSHTLYGFASQQEKIMFQHLVSVSGIGANSAIIMLSCIQADELYQIIDNEDISSLEALKGIGKKTAQRIVLELKDKIQKDAHNLTLPTAYAAQRKVFQEALTALNTLGINKKNAEKAIQHALENTQERITVEDLVKKALRNT